MHHDTGIYNSTISWHPRIDDRYPHGQGGVAILPGHLPEPRRHRSNVGARVANGRVESSPGSCAQLSQGYLQEFFAQQEGGWPSCRDFAVGRQLSPIRSVRGRRWSPFAASQLTHPLSTNSWAIRNCGLLLLRSLIDTLFGAVDTKASMEAGWDGVTTRIAYRKYPSLPGVLLDLVKSGGRDMMETGSQTTAAEAVFPALDIIRRAGPPEEQRDELYGHICRYLGSHLWHVREMAARTICSFLLTVDWIAEMKDLVRDSLESANKLHGSLLALRFVLERKAEVTTEDAQRVRAEITALVRTARPWRRCPEIRAASLEVDNHLLRRGDARPRAAPGLEAWTSLDPLAGPHSALLTLHQALAEINTMLMHDNVDGLSTCVTALVTSDTNAACKVLEVLPSMWTSLRGPSGHSSLYAIYLTVVSMTEAPDVRAQALVNMAELLDEDVRRQNWHQTPQTKDLSHAWKLLGQGPINPSLSHAILVFSGPLLAIVTRRVDSTDASVSLQILAWAAMMSDALGPEKVSRLVCKAGIEMVYRLC